MKKRLLALAALFVATGCVAQTIPGPRVDQTQVGTVTRARLEGSLESRQNIGCIRIDEAKPTYTAADLYAAVPVCVKAERYDDAAHLFYLAGMTLRFDTERIADRSVGMAREMLVRRTLTSFPKEQSEKVLAAIQSGANDPKKLAAVCEAVDKVGPPSYFPEYLVLHGIAAYGKADPFKDALVPDFDGAAKWRELKDKYLHCPRA